MNKITVGEMIAETRALNRGEYTDAVLMGWLSEVDARLYEEVVRIHIDAGDWTPYADPSAVLLAPAPYAALYRQYLDARIYQTNGESTRYNDAVSRFNAALRDYTNWYNRTHRVPRRKIKI